MDTREQPRARPRSDRARQGEHGGPNRYFRRYLAKPPKAPQCGPGTALRRGPSSNRCRVRAASKVSALTVIAVPPVRQCASAAKLDPNPCQTQQRLQRCIYIETEMLSLHQHALTLTPQPDTIATEPCSRLPGALYKRTQRTFCGDHTTSTWSAGGHSSTCISGREARQKIRCTQCASNHPTTPNE